MAVLEDVSFTLHVILIVVLERVFVLASFPGSPIFAYQAPPLFSYNEKIREPGDETIAMHQSL